MNETTLQSQSILLHSNYHKNFLTINQKKSSEKTAILNGDDTRSCVSVNDVLVVEDTAYIPITGVLYHSANQSCVNDFWTDYSFLHKQIQYVYQNDTITRVIFNVDSPGGMSLGMNAIASEIKELSANKQTIAIVNGLCCSAAYMLSANCSKIYATQGSSIGSIGVFCLIVDDKEYYEKLGLKIYSVGKPNGKTLGRSGQEVTQEYLKKEQEECDEIFENIVDIVSSRVSREKIMELDAGAFSSEIALSHGLIDGVLTAEQTLNNIFPKEETMETENNMPSTPPAQTSEGGSKGQSSESLDMKALFSGVAEAVKEGVSQGVTGALAQAKQEPTTQDSVTSKEGPPNMENLPSVGLSGFQVGSEVFENTNTNPTSTQGDKIIAAFNALSPKNTASKEVYIKAQEANNG